MSLVALMFLSTNIAAGSLQQTIYIGESAYISSDQLVSLASDDGFLAKPAMQTSDGERTGVNDIILYTARAGDTISQIAARYGISSDTVLVANGLNNSSILKPGKELVILPVDGLLHKIQKTDSLDQIAKKYSVDKSFIVAQNHLKDTTLKADEVLIIPGAKRVIVNPTTIARANTSRARTASSFSKVSSSGVMSKFANNCVLAERTKNPDLPYGLYTLSSKVKHIDGYKPVPGSTMVTSEGGSSGHVAHVEKVENGKVFVSECNYQHGKCTTRWIDADSPKIKGYIY